MDNSTTTNRELTYGEIAVGITFNPGGREDVNLIKKQYAEIIDGLNEIRLSSSGEKVRLCSIAITEAQTAQMWAVKAITS